MGSWRRSKYHHRPFFVSPRIRFVTYATLAIRFATYATKSVYIIVLIMPTKVYVGNLPEGCNQGQLRDLFGPYGQIAELDIIKNYAFIHFQNETDAKSAVGDLHKSKMQGKEIQVEISKRQNVNRDTRPPPRRHEGPDNRGPMGPPRGRMDYPR